MERYHDEDRFIDLFNPSKQIAYTRDLGRAFLGNAPTLGLVAKAFGPAARDNWLDIQITELALFSGCKDKMDEHQTNALIDIIAEEYGHLKVTELMYFFRRFKSGEYGKFYGAVDPLTITCALKDFCKERQGILRRLEREESERRILTDPEDIRFKRIRALDRRRHLFYSHNFRSKDFPYEEFEDIWWLFNLGYERNDHGYIGG